MKYKDYTKYINCEIKLSNEYPLQNLTKKRIFRYNLYITIQRKTNW